MNDEAIPPIKTLAKMSRRDIFAAIAMHGILSKSQSDSSNAVGRARVLADDLLRELDGVRLVECDGIDTILLGRIGMARAELIERGEVESVSGVMNELILRWVDGIKRNALT